MQVIILEPAAKDLEDGYFFYERQAVGLGVANPFIPYKCTQKHPDIFCYLLNKRRVARLFCLTIDGVPQ